MVHPSVQASPRRFARLNCFDSFMFFLRSPARRTTVPSLTGLIVLFIAALACGGQPDANEDPRGPDDVLPVSSPVSPEEEFAPEPRTFRIDPERSEARYEVSEELTFLGSRLDNYRGNAVLKIVLTRF